MKEPPAFDLKKLTEVMQKYRFTLLVLLVGAVLLLLPTEKTHSVEKTSPASELVSVEFDLAGLEEQMAETISCISGVGEAEVVLTLRSGSRRILAEDTDGQNDSTRRETVILNTGSGTQSVVTTQVLSPVFQGALVVCDGGSSPQVRLEVLHAVEALTGLGADCISISQRQSNLSKP